MNFRSNRNTSKFYAALARVHKSRGDDEKAEELNSKASKHNKRAKL